MALNDLFRLALGSVFSARFRSVLTAIGIAIGIASVVVLTAIGDGIHKFVLSEFTQFGTHLIGITPGKSLTHGVSPGAFANTRPMTIEDAEALLRIPQVEATVPVVQGAAKIEYGNRGRDTTVFGTGPESLRVWSLEIALGAFLPPDDPRNARSFVVLGSKVSQEIFGGDNPIGERVQIAQERYRVIGVMAAKGQILGFDLDDAVYIPAGKALSMFNRESLMEIDVLYSADANIDTVVSAVTKVLTQRHRREDFTIVTQQEMLDVLGSVLDTLTFAVAAVGSISLLVGAIGVLTIMTIAVHERTSEVGLLRALGARQDQVLLLFLGEAMLLAITGGLAGLILGLGCVGLLAWLVPALPINIAWGYVLVAVLLSGCIGLIAGVLPARYAAQLDPVEALRAE